MEDIRILALTGMVGSGYPIESFLEGLRRNPDIIGMDAGSTDGGAAPLGGGFFGVSPRGIRRDLSIAIPAVINAGKRLIIGSAGTAGANVHVDMFLDLIREIKVESSLRDIRIAVIRSEVNKTLVKEKIRQKKIYPMPGLIPELTEEEVDQAIRIVGQMGVEPYISAHNLNPDIILAGRSCDTAIYAAYPIIHGVEHGLAFHAAKIMECGAYAADPGVGCDCLMATFRKDYFELEPLNPKLKCTPLSVAAHTMYENAHPFRFTEPDGTVDCGDAVFEQVTPNAVRCRGAKFYPSEPGKACIKLEGARLTGYRSISIVGVHEPAFIRNYDYIIDKLLTEVSSLFGSGDDMGYSVQFRAYGKNAVLQTLETHNAAEHEIGIVIDVVAKTQELANSVCGMFRGSMMHMPYPGRQTIGGNLAFAFTPLDSNLGELFEFNIYHLMQTDDMNAIFPVEIITI